MRLWIGGLVIALVTLPLAADSRPPSDQKRDKAAIAVPYRLTQTQHVLVRVKLNGKGPFNFIVDTGAPALFVTVKVAEQAGVKAEQRGWTKFDRFEIEGGVVLDNASGRVENLFQLEGMNGLGMAGVEIHGVIGFNILARFRIEYDFTKTKLAWTPLDFEPPAVVGIGGRSASGGLDALGGMMKFLGAMLGMKVNLETQPRGFLGIVLADEAGKVIVRDVLADGPAARAGIKPGDVLAAVAGEATKTTDAVVKKLASTPVGKTLTVKVDRGGTSEAITLETGKGF